MNLIDSILTTLISMKKLCGECGCTFETPNEAAYFAAKIELSEEDYDNDKSGFCCPNCRE